MAPWMHFPSIYSSLQCKIQSQAASRGHWHGQPVARGLLQQASYIQVKSEQNSQVVIDAQMIITRPCDAFTALAVHGLPKPEPARANYCFPSPTIFLATFDSRPLLI